MPRTETNAVAAERHRPTDDSGPESAAMVPRDMHPVWAVYDRLRTARLSVKYYCAKLDQYERANFWLAIVLAATAPSSAVTGLWFWGSYIGHAVWQCVTVIAAVAALVKPALGLTGKIKDLESIVVGYRGLDFDLMEIKIGVEQKAKYDSALQADFRRALQRERALVTKKPLAREDAGLKTRLQAEVMRELPADAFFVPKE